MPDTKNLNYYRIEARKLADAVFLAVKELGELLLRAKKDLNGEDNDRLEADLRQWFTNADLKAAKMVADGSLAPDLFPHAVHSSKVLSLPEEDQQRLLSDEQFPVYTSTGGVDTKTWADMTPDQRSRLLGPKGGRIHALEEQRKPGQHIQKVTLYRHATCHGGRLTLTAGSQRGEIEVAVLRSGLNEDELGALIEGLQG